jgi:hypothetical protein
MLVMLVDYENIQTVQLERLDPTDFKVVIFIGDSQNKLPFSLVEHTQKFGSSLQWVKIEGTGSNALDFHIAFYLGKISSNGSKDKFLILSKDKGFDPLIKYVSKSGITCRRINSINEITQKSNYSNADKDYLKLLENLRKISKSKRPRKRKTLTTHAKSVLGSISSSQLNDIIDELFIQHNVAEDNGNLKYYF